MQLMVMFFFYSEQLLNVNISGVKSVSHAKKYSDIYDIWEPITIVIFNETYKLLYTYTPGRSMYSG